MKVWNLRSGRVLCSFAIAAEFHLSRLLQHSPEHAGLHVRRTQARMQLLYEDIQRMLTRTTMPRAGD